MFKNQSVNLWERKEDFISWFRFFPFSRNWSKTWRSRIIEFAPLPFILARVWRRRSVFNKNVLPKIFEKRRFWTRFESRWKKTTGAKKIGRILSCPTSLNTLLSRISSCSTVLNKVRVEMEEERGRKIWPNFKLFDNFEQPWDQDGSHIGRIKNVQIQIEISGQNEMSLLKNCEQTSKS